MGSLSFLLKKRWEEGRKRERERSWEGCMYSCISEVLKDKKQHSDQQVYMTDFLFYWFKSSCCSDKKIEKGFFRINFSSLTSSRVQHCTRSKTRIVKCDVNTGMPVAQFLGSSLFFGVPWGRHGSINQGVLSMILASHTPKTTEDRENGN